MQSCRSTNKKKNFTISQIPKLLAQKTKLTSEIIFISKIAI